MEHKKLKNKILLAMTTILLSANLLAVPIAAAADVTCNALNPKNIDPNTGTLTDDKGNIEYAEMKNNVVTINEEEIGGAEEGETIGEAGKGMKVIYCIRKTICTKEPKACNSFYVESSEKACEPTPDQNDPSVTLCQRVQVLSAPTGSALLYGYIGLIYRYAAGTIGIVSVLYLVLGGIALTTAGDNTTRIDEAKQKIFQSIAGLVLLFLSSVILYTINPNFFTIT